MGQLLYPHPKGLALSPSLESCICSVEEGD